MQKHIFVKKRIVIILSLFILHLSLLSSEAILSIDSGGHTSKIDDFIITKSGDIISVSKDKTIRIWNSRTGKEKRKILGQIGSGTEGTIYAVALSSDEKYLAVGGHLGSFTGTKPKQDEEAHKIRIYDYSSGKLLSILKSHTDAVNSLAFANNGDLYSGSNDRTIKLWKKKDKQYILDSTFTHHANSIVKVKPLENNRFVSTDIDNKIVLHDGAKVIKSYTHTSSLNYIAVSKTYLATCGYGNKILIFDKELNLTRTIISSIEPMGIKFSLDGNKLVAGAGTRPIKVIVYDVYNNFNEISSFNKHTNLTHAVSFLDQDTVISGGGNDKEIYIWKIIDSQISKKIVGNGKQIWRVGINENKIGFGNSFNAVGDYHMNYSSIEKVFDLNSMSIFHIDNNKSAIPKFKLIDSSNLLYACNSRDIYKDSLLKLPNGQYIKNNNRHNTYGWDTEKKFILSGGFAGSLEAYDNNSNIVAKFIGHTGDIWNIAIDGNTMVSGGSDQTIKVWDLSKLNSKQRELNDKSILDAMNYFNLSRENALKYLNQIGDVKLYKTLQIYPKASLFVGTDNEWVLWTKEGFFNASKNGAKYIGYHINQGSDKEAEFVTVDALYSTFYRPDLIQKALAGESLESYAKNINIDKLLKDGLPPEVHILTETTKTTTQDLDLKVQVCPKGNGGYDNLALMINDMPVSVVDTSRALKLKKKSDGREDCFVYDQTISLIGGKNTIGFKATNKAGNIESKPDHIEVTFDDTNLKNNLKTKLSKISGKQNINDLHILAIAVNEYKDKELQLNYSINDATAMLKTIENVAKPLFNNVHTYKLFDQDVTKQKIIDMFKNIKSTREDVFLLYIAGHGITDEYNGNYYYIPYDFIANDELDNVSSQGVGQKDFMLGLSNITALKSLVLLDTCNSGSFVEAELQKTTTNRLARATGRATISASSKSQVALEGFENHGVFTYTLLEALKGKAYNGDNTITTNELSDYVEDTLPDRTYKKWGYRQMPQKSLYGEDFSLGKKDK